MHLYIVVDWGLAADWLHAGAEIPDDPELETDLTAPQYGFSAKQQIQLEKKEDMKSRGCASPDLGDVLAYTFAVKLRSRQLPAQQLRYSDFPGSSQLAWMR
jgi:phage terminase large subunit